MKILLINNNPVVSRLTALSARKEEIELDEIQEVTELSSDKYDIVFVDADSLSKDVLDVISESINVQKKVLFFAQDDDEEDNKGFDITILKPFLPSEVSAVIRSLEEGAPLFPLNHEPQIEEQKEEKIEEVFNLDDDIADLPELETVEMKDDLFDDLIKEDTVSKETDFSEKLEKAFAEKSEELEDDLFDDTKIKAEDIAFESNDDLFELDLNDDKLSFDEALPESKPKDKELSLDDELLDFDFDNNDELDFESEKVEVAMDDLMKDAPKIEQTPELSMLEEKEVVEPVQAPKILDAVELANIKDILEDDVDDNGMELSDLMTTPTAMMPMVETVETKENIKKETEVVKEKTEIKEEQEEKVEKIEKVEEFSEINSDVTLETLANLPIENLRKLLAGAEVNISIKFPKD